MALYGPNGSGKSTLIEHLNGLLRPTSGSVTITGKNIDLSHADIWRDVGVVFQRSDDQLFAPTVLDDVMFGPINMGINVEQARKEAVGALKAVGAENLSDKMPGHLSGGQKRLVCIVKDGSIIAEGKPSSIFYDKKFLG